jgi:arabinofuranosyltransferase
MAMAHLGSLAQSAKQRVLAYWILTAFAAVVTVFLVHSFAYFAWGVDDSGLVFRYAVNLAEGRGLVYNPGERVEGFSDFGYVLMMSVAYAALGLRGRPEVLFVVAKFVGLTCSVAALCLTYTVATRFLRLEARWGLFACLMLAASGPFAIWAVGALETNVVLCALVATVYAYLRYHERRMRSAERGSVVRSACLCGAGLSLLTLLRADGFVFAGIVGAHWLLSRVRAKQIGWADWPVILFPMLTLFAYEAWRLGYYGYPLPNTYYAKVGPLWSPAVLVEGFQDYLEPYLDTLGGTGLVLSLAAISVYRDGKQASRFLAFVCVSYVAFVMFIGGDWMPGYRRLVPIIPLLLLLVVKGARHALRALGLSLQSTSGGVALCVGIATVLALQQILAGVGMLDWERQRWGREVWYAHPTFDARELVPYWDVATWLRDHADDSALLATHQAGFIPLLTELRTIDTFGLTDITLAHTPEGEGAVRKGRAGLWYRLRQAPAVAPGERYIVERRPDLYVLYTIWSKGSPQYLAGGEYALLESDLYGFDVYVPSGCPDRVLMNVASFGNASTTYSAHESSGTSGNVFDGGTWTSGCNDDARIESVFDRPFRVEQVAVGVAGTDITTDDSIIEFMLLGLDDNYVVVEELREMNVNWPTASDGGVLNSVPYYEVELSQPLVAKGFRMHLHGHGWFLASDVRVLGRAICSE